MQKNLALGLILLLCLSSVQSQLTAKTSAYPTTQCAGGKTPTQSRFTSPGTITASPPAIDGVSYSRTGATDATNEAIEIRYALSGSAGAWILTFTFTKSDGTSYTRIAPTLTDTAAPVLLAAQQTIFVFLAGSTRKAYSIDTTATGNIASTNANRIYDLAVPTSLDALATTISAFKVVSISFATGSPVITCYVEGTTSAPGIYANFVDYTITGSGSTSISDAATNAFYNSYAGKLPNPFTTLNTQGHLAELFFNRNDASSSGVVSLINGVYQKVLGGVVNVGNKATVIVQAYKLTIVATTSTICALTFVDGQDFDLVYGYFPVSSPTSFTNGANVKSHTAATGKTWKIYSDNLQNLLVVTSDYIVWIYTGMVGNAFIANPPQTGDYTLNDLNIYTANSVTFSGALAFAITTGKITVYQAVSATQIDLYAVISLDNDVLAQTVPSQQSAIVSCLCSTIVVKRFTCFSSTLACTTTVNAVQATCA